MRHGGWISALGMLGLLAGPVLAQDAKSEEEAHDIERQRQITRLKGVAANLEVKVDDYTRDPFTFGNPKKSSAVTEKGVSGWRELFGGGGDKTDPGDKTDLGKAVDEQERRRREEQIRRRQELTVFLNKLNGLQIGALKNMTRRRYAEAISQCKQALDQIDKKTEPDAVTPRIEKIILRVQRAAERLLDRATVETEFRNLGVEIRSIVWRKDKPPLAVIDDEVIREGQHLKGKKVHVYRIEPEAVIYIYDGYKIRRPLRLDPLEKP